MLNNLNSKLALVLGFLLLLIAIALLLPQSLGGYYQSHVLANMYLPDLGIHSDLSSVEPKPFIGQILLVKSMTLLFDISPLSTSHILTFFSVIWALITYILLFRILPDNRYKKAVALIFPVIVIFSQTSIFWGWILGPSMMLAIVTIYCLSKLNFSNQVMPPSIWVMILISYTALGFLWHSMFVFTFLFIIAFVLVNHILIRRSIHSSNISFILLIVVIFVVIWVYWREEQLKYAIIMRGNFDWDFLTLFLKGSFVGEYQYLHHLPFEYADKARYSVYIFVYLVAAILVMKTIRNLVLEKALSISHRLFPCLIISLLICDVFWNLGYYFANKTIAPMITLLFITPIIIIYLGSNPFPVFFSKLNPQRIIIPLLLILLIPTSIFTLHSYIVEDASRNIREITYQSSFSWITEYVKPKEILSDASTSGQYQMIYTNENIYQFHKMRINNINLEKYREIVNGEYINLEGNILVINTILYDRHLIMGALEDWNRFEPIAPEYIVQNTQLRIIYNDGCIVVAQ